MFLDNQDAARRFCPLNPKYVPGGATCNLITRRAKSRRPSQWKASGSSGPSAGQKGDSGAGRKAPVRGSARIVVRRPRLLQQHFCRQQKPPKHPPLKTNPKPGRRSGPVYCIVASLNPRVRLLRTKQRLFRSAGMLAAVAEPLASPPPTHLSKIPPTKTRTIIRIQPRPAFRFACFGLGLSLPLFSPLPYLGLNRVRSLRRHLTIFYRRAGTDELRTAADPPPTLGQPKSPIVITLQSGHIYRFSRDIYQNIAHQSGGGRRFSVLVRGSCHQPSCKSLFKKHKSAAFSLFSQSCSFDREPTHTHRPKPVFLFFFKLKNASFSRHGRSKSCRLDVVFF